MKILQDYKQLVILINYRKVNRRCLFENQLLQFFNARIISNFIKKVIKPNWQYYNYQQMQSQYAGSSKGSSRQSSQNTKIQRRSSSLRFKKYKEQKSQISQVYIKAQIFDKLTTSSGELDQFNHFTCKKNSSVQQIHLQKFNERFNRFQESKFKNNIYKRPLTPHKTAKQVLKRENQQILAIKSDQLKQQINKLNSLIDEKQIQIAQIQYKNKRIFNQNQILKAFAKELQKEKNKIVMEKQKLSKKILTLEQELNNKTIKLQKLQNTLIENQSNLTIAKNSLEKLKKIIKESRMAQLERQNKKLEQKLSTINKQNASLKQQYKNMQFKFNKLEKQYEEAYKKLLKIEHISTTNQNNYKYESMRYQYLNSLIAELRQKLNKSKQIKQMQLQNTISNLRYENLILTNKNKKLQVKVDCLLKNQLKSLQQLKKEKEKELCLLRDHFRKFLCQYKIYRKQHNQLKIQYLLLKRERDDQQISLSLSPQKN